MQTFFTFWTAALLVHYMYTAWRSHNQITQLSEKQALDMQFWTSRTELMLSIVGIVTRMAMLWQQIHCGFAIDFGIQLLNLRVVGLNDHFFVATFYIPFLISLLFHLLFPCFWTSFARNNLVVHFERQIAWSLYLSLVQFPCIFLTICCSNLNTGCFNGCMKL